MLITKKDRNFLRECLELLPKLGNYLLGLALLCYLSGFVIANLYLGSLGVVNLDILRVRYVLIGLLFLAFVGAILYLVYGLIQLLRRNKWETTWKLVSKAMWYSFLNISVLYFSVQVIGLLAGSVSSPPLGVPELSPAAPWSEWFATVPGKIVGLSAIYTVVAFLVIGLVMIAMIIINPKDKYGMKESRQKMLGELFGKLKENPVRFFGTFFGIFVFWAIVMTFANLLSFVATNQVSTGSSNPSFFSGGWDRFLGGIVIVYTILGTFLFFISRSRSSQNAEDGSEDNPVAPVSTGIYFISLLTALIIPVYALGIYPNLPQQVGGGKILQVDVMVSSDELKPFFEAVQSETYLVDRTSASILFLILDKTAQEYQIIEIPHSLIQSIVYGSPP